MRALLLLLVLLCTPRIAAGDDGVGVVVTGDSAVQPGLEAHIVDWLRERGHVLVAAPLPPDAVTAMLDCFVSSAKEDGCARGVFEKRGRSTTLVFARLEARAGDAGMRDVTLTAYWFEKGRDVLADRRFCERCTEPLLRGAADEVLSSLIKSGEHATGRLRLTSTPTGAKVVVGGQTIGVTPLDYDLKPGNHQVTLTLDRHEVETRPVAIREGETTKLDVPLVALRDTKRGLRPLPLALVLGGAAAVAAGVVLVAIDEDPSPMAPLEIRNTAPAGVAVAGVGGAMLLTGVWMWLRKSDSGPVTHASNDRAYLGWFVRF